MLASYLGVGWCREEKCVSILPSVGGAGNTCSTSYLRHRKEKCVSPTNVLASYLGVGRCRANTCVLLGPNGRRMC